MTNILHRVVIETSPETLYKALTEQEQLSAWWTKTNTSGKLGSVAEFFFGPNDDHKVAMKITELALNKRVRWTCVEGAWVETGAFQFEIQADERGSVLLFSHSGWNEANEFFMHCNSKWGFFLVVSLKALLETGTGQPHPNDPRI